MHVTVGDVNFYDGLECLYVKNKSRASTARELPNTLFLLVKTWLLTSCDTDFYAINYVNHFWFSVSYCMVCAYVREDNHPYIHTTIQ